MSTTPDDNKDLNEKNKEVDPDSKQTVPALKPDPETLHKTDPQENMKGPISSLMKNLEKEAEKNDVQSQEEATKKKDENT